MPLSDIPLDDSGDLPTFWSNTITGLDLIKQRIRTRLRWFLGEWILNQTQGIDFITWVTTKPPPLQTILLKTIEEIETIPGVARFENAEVEYTLATKAVTVTGTVVLDDTDDVTAAVGTVITLLGQGANTSPNVMFFAAGTGIATGGGI